MAGVLTVSAQNSNQKNSDMDNLSEEKQKEIREKISGLAKSLTIISGRAPILRTPADYDMEYEDLFFSINGWCTSGSLVYSGKEFR